MVTKQFPDYYLTGGTSLAIQLNHRFSEDLDFFTQKYIRKNPEKIMAFVEKKIGYPYEFISENNDPTMVKMKIFMMNIPKTRGLKIDFVEDAFPNINSIENGLHSLEDIFYRKICIPTHSGKEKTGDIGQVL